MFLITRNARCARLFAALAFGLVALQRPSLGQVPLASGTYTESFDGLADGLPSGWSLYTGANATSLGSAASLMPAAAWSSTSGQWRNSASAEGLESTTSTADQSAATNRALGIRQTGSFGDPGASANFHFATTGLQVSAVSFTAQMLSVQTRSTEWSLQYGLGAEPATWTTVATFADPGTFGSSMVTATGLGTALDDQSEVWLRVVALSGATGSGSRDTFGIDNFTIVTTGDSGGGGGGGGATVPPAITTQPESRTVFVGSSVTFSVVATGDQPFTYAWFKDDAPLGGAATGASLTIDAARLADAGSYKVTVTNDAGSDTSAVAVLTVNDLYFNLAGGDLRQDWSEVALITANDDWSGVPSIRGYLGQNLTSSTGADPQAVVAPSSAANDLDVIANQSNTTISNGGVAEFDGIADPVVALQGSGTADAPHLVLFLNTSGRTEVTVSYRVRDLDGSADDAVQAVALQYRVAGTGDFVNVPAAFVADATTGAAATQETLVSATLPAAVDNQAQVEIRIITTNASGSDEWVGIDDIIVSSVADTTPRVVVTQTAGATAVLEAGETTDTYTLRLGTMPSAPVTVRATADAQTMLSLDGTTFAAAVDVILSDTSPVTVTVRAVDDTIAETATHFGTITHTVVASTDANYPTSLGVPGLTVSVGDDDVGVVISFIHDVQGSGDASPLINQSVTIEGIVVADFQGAAPALGGFYVQEQDADADNDPATSEGILVYDATSSGSLDVSVGDRVTVTGTVVEFNGLTEISSVTAVTVDASAQPLPTAATVSLPVDAATALELYEGMRITIPQTLTVSGTRNLGQYGELTLTSDGRLYTPTHFIDVNDDPASGTSVTGISNKPAVDATLAAYALRSLILDDASTKSYPDPTPHLSAAGTRRVGDTVTGLTGVLSYGYSAYRVQATAPVAFSDTNPRTPAPPAVGDTNVRVASFNVLNYFNGNGAGGGFPTSRGANTAAEFARQRTKIIAAIQALDADIVGLLEIENDGVSPTSAIADLVAGLNTALGAGTYAIGAAPPDVGTDEIKCAFIYKPAVVTPDGAPYSDGDAIFDRPPVAQAFVLGINGGRFTVCLNHLKSKGSGTDDGSGQGASNGRRRDQATRLLTFLDAVVTAVGDPDVLIIGDLNAYAEEDPIDVLRTGAFADQIARFNTVNGVNIGYSYNFDEQSGYLDHALANLALAPQVTGAFEWHINADEPDFLDYNVENKSTAQQAVNVGTPYRSSDHDPVLIGLAIAGPAATAPSITGQPAGATHTVGAAATFSVTASGTSPFTYQWLRGTTPLTDHDNVTGATSATLTVSPLTTADAGDYTVVVTNRVGSATSSAAALVVTPATATVSLDGLAATYTGAAQTVTATTTPTGLSVTITYDQASTAPTDAGSYAVVATIADADYTGSASGTLVIAKAAQTVTFDAVPAGLPQGVPTTLAATASSGLPVTFSVVSGPATISGAVVTATGTGAVVLRAAQSGNANYEPAASVDKTVSVIAAVAAPVITVQPQGITADEGTGVIFTVGATGNPTPTYQWQKNGVNLAGATSASLALATVQPTDAGAYRVVVSNGLGSATSDTATLVVVAAPDPDASPFAGVYQINLGAGLVASLVVNSDGSFTLIGLLPDTGEVFLRRGLIAADGSFAFAASPTTGAAAAVTGRPHLLSEPAGFAVSGRLTAAAFTLEIPERRISASGVRTAHADGSAQAGLFEAALPGAGNRTLYVIAAGPGQRATYLLIGDDVATGGETRLSANGSLAVSGGTTGATLDLTLSTGGAVSGTVAAPGETATPVSGRAASLVRRQFVNLSARAEAGNGDATMIAGLVIRGTQPKTVLVRAVGPGLTGFGVGSALADPQVRIERSGTTVASNDNWSGSAAEVAAMVRVGAFALQSGSADALTLATLEPGAYTVLVSGASTGAGVVLLEVYDATDGAIPTSERLVNLSTRGMAGPGERVLTAGFVVTGNTPKRVLIRGIGPGLAPFGVAGVLADPQLKVYAGETVIATNDDWAGAPAIATAVVESGAFAIADASADAALVLTLEPGAYTAQVSGVGVMTGVAMIEIYELP